MELTHRDIAEIIKLIDDSTLDELVLEVGGVRIEARRKGAMISSTVPAATAAAVASPPPSPAPPWPPAPIASADVAPTTVAPGQVVVTAPMVGTFYRRSSPDSPPFVEVGSRVNVGDALCLVEVMKLYTTVSAEQAATVVAVCADDAALVEYGQILFILEPD